MVLYDSGNSGYNRTKVVEGRREDLKKQSSFQHTIDGMKTTLTFQKIEKLDKELTGKERKLEQLKTELRNAREEAKICTGTNLKDSKALIKEKKLHILDQSARIAETIERLEREKHEITSSNGNNNLMDT